MSQFVISILCALIVYLLLRMSKLKTQHKQSEEYANAETLANITWEKLMMELVGEDGPGSVRTAIEAINDQLNKWKHDLHSLENAYGQLKTNSEQDRRIIDNLSEMLAAHRDTEHAIRSLVGAEDTEGTLPAVRRWRDNHMAEVQNANNMIKQLREGGAK